MWPAERCKFAALDVEIGSFHARVVRTTLAADVYHDVVGMLSAVPNRLALNIETRPPHAGVIRATLAENVHHVVVSMLAAIKC